MTAVTLQAITVIGHDRPGIIAETTRLLADLGLNIEDSTMTLLRGHFAMMLLCSGAVSPGDIEQALAPLTDEGSLTVTVRELAVDSSAQVRGTPWVLTVHGGDRPGIVSSVIAEVARVGGNVTDLATRLSGDLYLLVAEFDLPRHADPEALRSAVARTAGGLGVEASLRPGDVDEL